VRLDINCPSLHEEFLGNWSDPTRRDDRQKCWTLELPLTLRKEVVGTLEFYSEPNGRPVRQQLDEVIEIAEIFQDQARYILGGEEKTGLQDGQDVGNELAVENPTRS